VVLVKKILLKVGAQKRKEFCNEKVEKELRKNS
jgi:hypothetical protein